MADTNLVYLQKLSEELQSVDDNSSKSSSASGSRAFDSIKQDLSKSSKKTPRLLTIVINLVLLVFLANIIISSINYYIITKNNIKI